MARRDWTPGNPRNRKPPSFAEAEAYDAKVQADPGTHYRGMSPTERASVTGVTPSTFDNVQMEMFPEDPTPRMDLDRHSDISPKQAATNEKNAAKFAGQSVENMGRKASFDVDSALASGLSTQFYSKTARDQIGGMAQRTGVDYQVGAAAAATTSPQKPWMLGERELNVELAEAQIEHTIREKDLGRQEKYKPHGEWDALQNQDRDYRYDNVLRPMLTEVTPDVAAKTQAVVEHGAAGGDPKDAHWGGQSGDKSVPVFGSGMKETSFYQGFRHASQPHAPHQTNRVTLDRHMSDSLVGRDLGDKFRTSAGRYRIGAGAYEAASRSAGISPEAGQAVAWTHIKEGKGHGGGLYDESGEGVSAVERKSIADANPPMIRERNDEFIPNSRIKGSAPQHVSRPRTQRRYDTRG